jgi:hypothetical protein
MRLAFIDEIFVDTMLAVALNIFAQSYVSVPWKFHVPENTCLFSLSPKMNFVEWI